MTQGFQFEPRIGDVLVDVNERVGDMQFKIKSEKHLRTLFSERWEGFKFAVEPTRGSSIGVPDFIVGNEGALRGIELKVGELRMRQGERVVHMPHLRPAQIKFHGSMADHGIEGMFIVGILGTDKIFVFKSGDVGFITNKCIKSIHCISTDVQRMTFIVRNWLR